jgi:hypothetical protein
VATKAYELATSESTYLKQREKKRLNSMTNHVEYMNILAQNKTDEERFTPAAFTIWS